MTNHSFKNLTIIWISFLMLILVLTLINSPSMDYDSIGFVAVTLHAIIAILFIAKMPIKGSKILVWAFIARFIFMLWDLYARDIFVFPNSGADTEVYYTYAEIVSKDFSNLSMWIHGGLYSKILGVVFYLTGPMRILAQYINVLLGLSTVVIIYKVMLELKINSKTTTTVLAIASFLPNSLIMSAILLREILPTFFVALSLLWFIRWFQKQSIPSFVFSIVMIGIASMFHSGVVGIVFGYLFAYLFYNQKSKRFVVSFKNILLFIPVMAFVLLFTTQFGDAMFGKFRNLEEVTDIYESVNVGMGGSAYLQGMTINSPLQFLLYAPIRSFYFLTSPLPMNWRGVMDIITFLIDSIFYIYVIYFFIKNTKWFINNKCLIIILLVSIIVVSIIFGIGVGNSGTAMRHRQKITPLFLLILSVMMNEKYRAKELIKSRRNRYK